MTSHTTTSTVVEAVDVHKTLSDEVISGLQQRDPYIPSLFLWDAKGLQIYEKIINSESYYLSRAEIDLMEERMECICAEIPDNTVIVDFGSGCTSKAAILLRGLTKQRKGLDYYSLDVSHSEVERNLESLKKQLPKTSTVKCHPLVVTYAQGLEWLASNPPAVQGRPLLIMWLGSSIGNENSQEIRGILNKLNKARIASGLPFLKMLIGLDRTMSPDQLYAAYDVKEGYSRQFVCNALQNANKAFGHEMFRLKDWRFTGKWIPEEHLFWSGLETVQETAVRFASRDMILPAGHRLRVIISRKWTHLSLEAELEKTAFEIRHDWRHRDQSYCEYLPLRRWKRLVNDSFQSTLHARVRADSRRKETYQTVLTEGGWHHGHKPCFQIEHKRGKAYVRLN